jgi:hypothetical protein
VKSPGCQLERHTEGIELTSWGFSDKLLVVSSNSILMASKYLERTREEEDQQDDLPSFRVLAHTTQ